MESKSNLHCLLDSISTIKAFLVSIDEGTSCTDETLEPIIFQNVCI